MAFFPDIIQGQEFIPSALLSNNVRRIVNGLNGFHGNRFSATGAGTVRIQIYNALENSIGAGTAVNFSESGTFCDGAIPAIPLIDPARPWGVVTQKLEPAQMGDCFISGPVTVAVTGSGDFAQPTSENPGVFVRGSTGAPVLFASNGKGLLNLGAGREYDGPFAVRYDANTKKVIVSGGYCLVNLSGYQLPEMAIAVEVESSGFVVIESQYSSGAVSTPTLIFMQNRPVPEYKKCGIALGEITLINGNVSVKQLHYGDINAVIWGNCEDEEA